MNYYKNLPVFWHWKNYRSGYQMYWIFEYDILDGLLEQSLREHHFQQLLPLDLQCFHFQFLQPPENNHKDFFQLKIVFTLRRNFYFILFEKKNSLYFTNINSVQTRPKRLETSTKDNGGSKNFERLSPAWKTKNVMAGIFPLMTRCSASLVKENTRSSIKEVAGKLNVRKLTVDDRPKCLEMWKNSKQLLVMLYETAYVR